ncbi:MAG: hypothetical protein WKF84_00655 [Pyrinomonadaceae bacterium]
MPTTQSNTTGDVAEEDAVAVKSKRPTVSRPAEFQGAGLLQIEYGYDGNFRSRDLRRDEAGSLTISFAATNRLQLELDLDTVASQVDRPTGTRTDGLRRCASRLSIHDTPRHNTSSIARLRLLHQAAVGERDERTRNRAR